MARRDKGQPDELMEGASAEPETPREKPLPLEVPTVKYRVRFKGGGSQLVDDGCAAVYRRRPNVESVKIVRIRP